MMKCTNEISEMSFAFYDTGHVVLSEAWWRGQTRENISAGTRNRRKTEVVWDNFDGNGL